VAGTGAQAAEYGVASSHGLPVAGVGAPTAGVDLPPMWTTYLAVEDADSAAAAVAAHGGRLLAPPATEPGRGRGALARDPTGAVFGLWQAEAMIGMQLANEPVAVVWTDQRSPDPDAARAFYAAVFGYTYTGLPGVDGYTTVDGAGPGGMVAGIGGPDDDLPPNTPAHWMVYFAVENVPAVVEAASAGGGRVVVPTADGPYGQVATLADPLGALLRVGSGGESTSA
jgi:hypothetical protein